MKDVYLKTKGEIEKALDSSPQGLTTTEANSRFQKFGPNALEETKKQTTLQVFLSQFKDLMVIILIIAALISASMGDAESTIVILVVLILNAVLGTIQHIKAEKSLASLRSLSSPSAKVLRDGQLIEIPSTQVVPGDIMNIEAGDMVVADGRILDLYSLQVNESSLTGESTNVDKADVEFDHEVPLGDRLNMVYSG
ncbi:MAG: HAD-IC family P-type ATPase, partial [Absicoccus porci]